MIFISLLCVAIISTDAQETSRFPSNDATDLQAKLLFLETHTLQIANDKDNQIKNLKDNLETLSNEKDASIEMLRDELRIKSEEIGALRDDLNSKSEEIESLQNENAQFVSDLAALTTNVDDSCHRKYLND